MQVSFGYQSKAFRKPYIECKCYSNYLPKIIMCFTADEPTLMSYLQEAKDMGDKITEIFMVFSTVFCLFTVLLGVSLVVYYFIHNGQVESDDLFLPYNYV